MPLPKPTVKFEGLNENHSYCSAWIKDKNRHCRRTVADSDQKRRRFLIQSISSSRDYAGDDAEEFADLYFCKGWHRKGGRYAIPSTESLKVLQVCFSRAPGANETSTTPQLDETDRRTTPPGRPHLGRYIVGHEDRPFSIAPVFMGSYTASRPSDAPASLMTNRGSRFEGPEIPEIEQLSFSIAQSAQNPMENDAFTLSNPPAATSTLVSIRPESSPVEPLPRERDFQQQAEAEHPSLDHVHETNSIQLRRSARIRGLEPGDPSEASRLTRHATTLPVTTPATRTRRSARIRGQQPEAAERADPPTASRSQVARTTSLHSAPLRRSARIRGQGQNTNVDAPAAQILAAARTPAPQSALINRPNDRDHIQPTQSSPSVSARRGLEHRMTRDVNVVEDCGICKEALGVGSNVARCSNCANDFHRLCLAEWCTTGSKTCGYCRAPFPIVHVKELIDSLEDEGTRFGELDL